MNPQQLHSTRWFKSEPTLLQIEASNIDAQNGVIKDVVLVQDGPAKGHGFSIEADFIEKIVKYDQKYFSKRGQKARFGHPSASSDTMGTQMGVFLNFRLREMNGKQQEIADLHLLDSAEHSPTHPGMKTWMLSMAAERPDFVMSSIVFKPSGYYQYDEKGKKMMMKVALDEWGNAYWENYITDKEVFADFDANNGAEHSYTDLVEQGAATETLFSNQVNPHLYVAQADSFLEDHPHIKQFMTNNPDKVQAFLASIGVNLNVKMAQETPPNTAPKTLLQKFFSTISAEDEQAFRQEIFALQTAKDVADKQVENLTSQLSAVQATVKQLETAAADHATQMSAKDARITELEALAADVPTGGPTPANGDEKKDEKFSAEQKETIRKQLRGN